MAATGRDHQPAATDRQAVEDSLRELISAVVGAGSQAAQALSSMVHQGSGRSFLIGEILDPVRLRPPG